jgi:23S rRNA (cytidine1920-2'-O)/16S rRNA (cytidine1409-2'-O)-methyltransferase
MAARRRADQTLVERGLVTSRAEAQRLILAGSVHAENRRIEKPGTLVASETVLSVRRRSRFVSRGGEKLDAALETLAIDVGGLVAADFGASTGGFTDCLLERGACHVYAVDVGRGQLADKLRRDPRVTVMDGVNARHLTREAFARPPELVSVDASFISLVKLLPAIDRVLAAGGRCVALVKPQFEVGRDAAHKARGVIRDPELRQRTIRVVLDAIEAAGFALLGECPCALSGPKGNLEHFVCFARAGEAHSTSTQIS